MRVYKCIRQVILYCLAFVFVIEITVLSLWTVEHRYNCMKNGVATIHQIDYNLKLVFQCEEEVLNVKKLSWEF